jgi:hypothetical protein
MNSPIRRCVLVHLPQGPQHKMLFSTASVAGGASQLLRVSWETPPRSSNLPIIRWIILCCKRYHLFWAVVYPWKKIADPLSLPSAFQQTFHTLTLCTVSPISSPAPQVGHSQRISSHFPSNGLPQPNN